MPESEPPRTEPVSTASAPEARPPGQPADASRGSRRADALAWTVILVIAYLLSPLPVNLFLSRMPPGMAAPAEKCLEVAYSPLAWLYGNSQQVQEFYDWYKGLLDV